MLTSGAAAGVAAGPDRRDSGGEAAGLSKAMASLDERCEAVKSVVGVSPGTFGALLISTVFFEGLQHRVP